MGLSLPPACQNSPITRPTFEGALKVSEEGVPALVKFASVALS